MSRAGALVIALSVLLLAQVALAQSVKVRTSSRQIADDEDLQVTFSFQGRGEGRMPNLRKDWKIVGQHSSVNTQFINGQVTREHSQVMMLRPKRTGTLLIPPAQIVAADGSVLASSQPVRVLVRGVAAMRPSQARLVANLPQDDVILVPELERDVYFVGEPFVATWSLYVQKGLRIREPDTGELDLPDDIQRENVLTEIREEGGSKRFFGKVYARVPVIREVWKVLRPTQVTIPAVRVNVDLPSRGFRADRKRVKTPPLLLDVRPVPTTGRPDEYREGTIGVFTIEAQIAADEEHGRAVLEVRIAGNGSLKTLDPPALDKVTGARVKALPSDDRDMIDANADGVVGHRVFQYLLTPERAGTVFIPPITLTYFNPKSRRFETTSSEPAQWVAKRAVASTRRSAVGIAGIEDSGPGLHPIESESDLITVDRVPVRQRGWFYALLGLPLLGFLLVETRNAWSVVSARGSGKSRARRALSRANDQLKGSEALLKEGRHAEVFSVLASTLREYVQSRMSLSLSGMTNDQMRVSLARAGVAGELIEQVVAELESCDFARFAGGAGPGADASASLGRARTLLAALEQSS